jgi:hypothetical protein
MSLLPTYPDLPSKAEAFEQIIIDTKNDVERFISEISNEISQDKNRRFIYRGVADSRYKIFNSAQRHYNEKELIKITSYDNLILGLINEALNYQNGLLRKYLEGFLVPYHIPVLSFLQHYGAPTPLIDWTYNLQIALFFSTDGQRHNASNRDIDNYFSIYRIDKGACGSDLINISKYLALALSDIYRIIRDNPEVDAEEVLNNNIDFEYTSFKDVKLFYISDFERFANIPSLTTQTNLNIINQEGLFIFNASETEPLEAFFGTERDPFYALPKIKCYDIHKSLYHFVLNQITEVRRDAGLIKLTKEFIYPQEEDIAKKAFENYLAK